MQKSIKTFNVGLPATIEENASLGLERLRVVGRPDAHLNPIATVSSSAETHYRPTGLRSVYFLLFRPRTWQF